MKLPESRALSKIDCLRIAGNINRMAMQAGFMAIREGSTLEDADAVMDDCIRKLGGTPAFLGYHGFPASACISLNNQVVHTVPDDRAAQDGDVVTIDIGTEFGNWNVDAARTEIIGQPRSAEDANLVRYGQEVLLAGLQYVVHGACLQTIAQKMDAVAHERYLTIIPELGGHRIGKSIHETPFLPMTMIAKGLNYDYSYTLRPGDIMCFEPIIVLADRSPLLRNMPDGWTVETRDGGTAVHFEHTVIVTEHGHEVIA